MPNDESRSGTGSMRRFASRSLLGVAVLAGGLALAPRAAFAQQNDNKPPSQQNLDDIEYGQLIDPNSSIDADKMLKVWATKLKILIVVDPQMAGVKIKFLTSDVNLTWGLFKKVLDFYDIVLDEKEVNGHWLMFAHLRRNLPQREAPPFPFIDKDQPLPNREQVVTAVIQVVHGAGNDIFATVRGLLVRDVNRIGNILYVRGPEVIIIVDFAANVEYYTKIIRALDVPAPGQVTRVINVEFAPAEDVAKVIQSLLRPTSGGGGAMGGVAPPIVSAPGGNLAQPQIIADPRTNKLIIQAYAYQFDEINRMIKELDVRAPIKPPKFHLYKCKNVDAGYLAGKLSELFTGQKGAGSTHHGGGATGAKGPGQAGGGGGMQGGGVVSLTPQGGQGGQGKSDFSAVETRVVPDELQNALLIQAEEPIYKQILSLLEGSPDLGPGLDHPRRRVLIEAQVWEISTPADNLTIGFELAGIQNPKQGAFRPSGLTDFGLSNISLDPNTGVPTRVPNITQGLTAVLTKDTFSKLPLIMQAIASLEKSRVVTTPFALTNDNETAHFDVTLTTSYQTNTLAGTGLSQSSFTPLQIPSSIDVTPEVNSDDNVTLDVDVNISTASGGGGNGAPPNVNARHLKVVVTVPNMRYVIFGGLESESFDESETKVPWLGDIPILGHLFKTKSWTHNNSKIYIFVRPTIFSDDQSLTRPSDEIRKRAHVEAERDDWIPPIVSERLVRAPWKTVQDNVFDVFGTGSGNPFNAQPKDE